jgi:hypothetical protein
MRSFHTRHCAVLLAIALPVSFAGAASAQSVITSESTVITLTSAANPVVDGSVTLTAKVATTAGSGVPDGSIAFRDMTTMRLLAWTKVDKPTVTVANLSAGRHEIRADYTGTDSYLPLIVQPSQSALLVQTVLVTPQVTLSSSQQGTAPDQTVTLTATVTAKLAVPTGTVTFRDGSALLAAHVALDARGRASFTTSALADCRDVTATYEGDAGHTVAAAKLDTTPHPEAMVAPTL